MGHNGLHNILEPAAFGLPIVIGPVYDKFPEALDLLKRGGLSIVRNPKDAIRLLDQWCSDPKKFKSMGAINQAYIQEHSGATKHIINHLTSAQKA
jgi:3-deoxy-D-manno-octulosonic-acid transferase